MKKVMSVAVATALFGSVGVNAHVPEEEWREFKAQYAALAERVNALEAENQQLRSMGAGTFVKVEDLEATNAQVAALKKQNKMTSWAEKIKIKGDFRYRHEEIDQDNKDDRSRQRVRARMSVIAKGPENTEIGLGLASGSDDPVSTNQTLGNGASTKDINLDLAYFTWKPDNFYLTGGKYKNNFWRPQKSGLLWDGDLRHEGAAVGYKGDLFFVNAGWMWIESDENKDDEGMAGIQVGSSFNFGEDTKLKGAVAYYDFEAEGRAGVFESDDFFGNENANGAYINDFTVINGSVELSTDLFGLGTTFYGDYAYNDDADDYDTGWIVGVAMKPGKFSIKYQYQELEPNAVLGAWTDSDFMGGGTDGEGHKIGLGYKLTKRWSLAATYFDGSTGVDLGGDDDYQRLQLDTKFKY